MKIKEFTSLSFGNKYERSQNILFKLHLQDLSLEPGKEFLSKIWRFPYDFQSRIIYS